MKHIACIFLITALFFSCKKEEKYPYKLSDFRPELRTYLNQLLAEKILSIRDTTANNYLRDSCSKEELVKLLQCKYPLLRIISYMAIVDRNESDYFPILLNHLDDTAIVTSWHYDLSSDNYVTDRMIREVLYRRKLTQKQKDSLVDIVLREHNYLKTASRMIPEIKPQEKYYSIIRARAQQKLDKHSQDVVIYALAKFRKPEDIPLIKRKLLNYDKYNQYYVFKSIEAFPDTSFFPVLIKYFTESIKKEKHSNYNSVKYYCRAVAVYKNEESLQILTALTQKETYPDSTYLKKNKEWIFKAMHKYPSPIYSDLYNQLKPQMSSYIIKYLDSPDRDDITYW